MPAAFTTAAHFTVSLRKNVANSSGELATISAPSTASLSRISLVRRIATISFCNFESISAGVAAGAIIAARVVPLHRAVGVLPVGITMGLVVIFMLFVRDVYLAMLLMTLVGGLAGFFVVPMNALLWRLVRM